MEQISTETLWYILLVLLIMSALFSATETAMISLNRIRVRHAAKTSKVAKVALSLLNRTDRMLATILIGNNFVNIAASSVATIIGIRFFGEIGAIHAATVLTIIILLFSEITPKTLAAINPDKIAYKLTYPLKIFQILIFPIVILSNSISNGILRICGIKDDKNNEHLSIEELKILVNETSNKIPAKNKSMLSSILELNENTVDDIMIPRSDIIGIDLNQHEVEIAKQLSTISHTLIPVFKEDINNVQGFIHMRDISKHCVNQNFNKDNIQRILREPYFIPEGTPLNRQLVYFQQNKNRIALVVDEYGDVQGIVTLADILEEIVGEFTTNISIQFKAIQPHQDGSFIIDGSSNIRVLNKTLKWQLPTDGAKTLSGAIIEYLEAIPENNTCLEINGYKIEILQVQDNMVKTVKVLRA